MPAYATSTAIRRLAGYPDRSADPRFPRCRGYNSTSAGNFAVGTGSKVGVMKSLKGHLLVASPDLLDPNFLRSVVLMIQHNEEGAFGVILNRPTDVTIKALWEQVSSAPCQRDEQVFIGGPVEGPLIAIHSHDASPEHLVLPGVYVNVEKDEIERLIGMNSLELKCLIGYAGWGAGQLESELSQGSWLTIPARRDHVFEGGEDLWDDVNKEILGQSVVAPLKIKHIPIDPQMN